LLEDIRQHYLLILEKRRGAMIKDFDVLKKQLEDMAGVINRFKSEAVQLRLAELLFQRMELEGKSTEKKGKKLQATPKKTKKSRTEPKKAKARK
jgi:hypothetical protein